MVQLRNIFVLVVVFAFFALTGLKNAVGMVGFQDSASPMMEAIVDLHNHIFFYLVLVFGFVFYLFCNIVYNFWYQNRYPTLASYVKFRSVLFNVRSVNHGTVIEIIWTIIPILILIMIAIPSIALLYAMDEVVSPSITLKVIGHQWYWTYEYSDYNNTIDNIVFDSYMLPEEDLTVGQFRLLEVDNAIVLPVNTHIRVLVTASDVLHSWSVNSLGTKVDAVPGRISQLGVFLKREGTYYGQCSELCGVNHGFMPIVVKAVSVEDYKVWLLGQSDTAPV